MLMVESRWSVNVYSLKFFFNFAICLKMFVIKCYKKETGEVFRDQIMLSIVGLKEFGPYPKMGRKPSKDFDRGEI